MFDRFDEPARASLDLAYQLVRRLGHEFIDTEHLLLGLLETGCVAGFLLQRAGVEPDALRAELAEHVPRGARLVGRIRRRRVIPFTANARRALGRTVEIALEFGQERVGTEHLLLGLIAPPGGDGAHGAAAKALAHLGVTRDALMSCLHDVLADERLHSQALEFSGGGVASAFEFPPALPDGPRTAAAGSNRRKRAAVVLALFAAGILQLSIGLLLIVGSHAGDEIAIRIDRATIPTKGLALLVVATSFVWGCLALRVRSR